MSKADPHLIDQRHFESEFLSKRLQSRKDHRLPFRLVQLGACQGFERNDPIMKYKTDKQTYGILVEPVPHNVDKLKFEVNKRKLGSRLMVKQAAVGCENDVNQSFYMVSAQFARDKPRAVEWNKYQVGSFNRDHVYVHLCRPGASPTVPQEIARGNYWHYEHKNCSQLMKNQPLVATEYIGDKDGYDSFMQNHISTCNKMSECGALSFRSFSNDKQKNVVGGRIYYASSNCSTSNDYLVEDSSTDEVYIKRTTAMDKSCPNNRYITEVQLECLRGETVLDEWQRYAYMKFQNTHEMSALNLDVRKDSYLEWGNGVDLLLVDVEGFDYKVIQTLGLEPNSHCTKTGICVSVIVWESIHLSPKDKVAAKATLKAHNFDIYELTGNAGIVTNMLGIARSIDLGS